MHTQALPSRAFLGLLLGAGAALPLAAQAPSYEATWFQSVEPGAASPVLKRTVQ